MFFNIVIAPFSAAAALFGPAGASGASAALTSPLITAFSTVFDEIGYLLAGLMVMPIINIVIVDVFIIDFSKAVGEQMSFSQLFKQVI
jgi:L-asparagine transporter-like permease